MDKHISLSLLSLAAAFVSFGAFVSTGSIESNAAYMHLSDLGSYTSVQFDQNMRIYNEAVSHENVSFVQWSTASAAQH